MKKIFLWIVISSLFICCKNQNTKDDTAKSLPWKTEWYIGIIRTGAETVKTELKLIYPKQHCSGGSYLLMETHYGQEGEGNVEIKNGKWLIEPGDTTNNKPQTIALYFSNDTTAHARYMQGSKKLRLLDNTGHAMGDDCVLYLRNEQMR